MSAKYEAPKPSEPTSIGPEEAQAIRAELCNIQKSLSTGEQEKVHLMKSLACLKDELTRIQDPEINEASAEKFSNSASQTDFEQMNNNNVGARLAEMAKLRLQYEETRYSRPW